jgi:hypothetical protein
MTFLKKNNNDELIIQATIGSCPCILLNSLQLYSTPSQITPILYFFWWTRRLVMQEDPFNKGLFFGPHAKDFCCLLLLLLLGSEKMRISGDSSSNTLASFAKTSPKPVVLQLVSNPDFTIRTKKLPQNSCPFYQGRCTPTCCGYYYFY